MLLDFFQCDAVELRVSNGRREVACEAVCDDVRDPDTDYLSVAFMPLVVAEETIGALRLKSRAENFFPASEMGYNENVAQTLGLALVNQQVHASLRERVKELTCLYCITQLADRPDVQLCDLLQGVVELLPPAWQYPEIAVARIIFDDTCYATADFSNVVSMQSAALVVKGHPRGNIEIGYSEKRPELDEGPFLKEERSLIDTLARQIALLIERRQAAEEKDRLQVQLRHADRLATIGQLSAGVAHELNEPLGNILAYAQLAGKESGLSPQTAADLQKIVVASLHAREIIKKLMLFARQMPPRMSRTNLNAIVQDGLFFLESRCRKDGVIVERRLSPEPPEVVADPSQLHQVLVNLVVNAVHAMPGGGILKITTLKLDEHAILCVEDNGAGMSKKVLQQIFIPFFTTKDVHEGTGLGLSVVHGIVTSHGGVIDVQSSPGKGSRFEIRLPLAKQERNEGGHDE